MPAQQTMAGTDCEIVYLCPSRRPAREPDSRSVTYSESPLIPTNSSTLLPRHSVRCELIAAGSWRDLPLSRRSMVCSSVAELILAHGRLGSSWWDEERDHMDPLGRWKFDGSPKALLDRGREPSNDLSVGSSLGLLASWACDDIADAGWGRPVDFVDLNDSRQCEPSPLGVPMDRRRVTQSATDGKGVIMQFVVVGAVVRVVHGRGAIALTKPPALRACGPLRRSHQAETGRQGATPRPGDGAARAGYASDPLPFRYRHEGVRGPPGRPPPHMPRIRPSHRKSKASGTRNASRQPSALHPL
jgi:hypothetical protein